MNGYPRMHWKIAFVALFVASVVFSNPSDETQEKKLTFGILLPNNPKLDFSLHRVLPVIHLAIQRAQIQRKLLPEWQISVLVRDNRHRFFNKEQLNYAEFG